MGKIKPLNKNKIELGIFQRVLIANTLNTAQGSYEKLIVRIDLQKKVLLTQEEIMKYGFNSEGAKMQVNEAGANYKKSFEFTPLELDELKTTLENLSKSETLPIYCLDLYKTVVKP